LQATDLELLIDAALEAGRIASPLAGGRAKRWEKSGNAGPVTEADIAVNEMLEDRLRRARPDYGWLSEETEDDDARLSCDAAFVIDPIDGTRSFAEGSRTWAHALAVVRGGVAVAGVIYLPQRDLLYAAARGAGAALNGQAIAPGERAEVDGARMLTNRGSLDPQHWRGAVPAVERAYRPSLAYRMALVAEGRFDAMLTVFPAWEWDVAAGAVILDEAGAAVTDRAGAALRFNNAHPRLPGLVAGGRALHAGLMRALAPA
jgi:myo-inositol-1(or 4)-monophosphatase